MNVVLKLERWESRLEISLETGALVSPSLLVFVCDERQRQEFFQLRGYKPGCSLVN